MLTITDLGCCRHNVRHLRLFGPEAYVMHDVLANLPGDAECHTYICHHGYSHRLAVEIDVPAAVAEAEKKSRLVSRNGKNHRNLKIV